MKVGNSHCFCFADKETNAKIRDEYRVGGCSRGEQEQRTQTVLVLWIPVPSCQLLSHLLTSSHAELSLVYSYSSHSSIARNWGSCAPRNYLTSVPPDALLAEFKIKAVKMLSASQNGNSFRLIWHICSLAENDFPRDFHPSTMRGHLSVRSREGVSLGTVTMAKL